MQQQAPAAEPKRRCMSQSILLRRGWAGACNDTSRRSGDPAVLPWQMWRCRLVMVPSSLAAWPQACRHLEACFSITPSTFASAGPRSKCCGRSYSRVGRVHGAQPGLRRALVGHMRSQLCLPRGRLILIAYHLAVNSGGKHRAAARSDLLLPCRAPGSGRAFLDRRRDCRVLRCGGVEDAHDRPAMKASER